MTQLSYFSRLSVFGAGALLLGTAALAEPPGAPRTGDGGVSAFYTWPDAIPATPGKLLRAEALPADLTLSEAADAKRILYTSTDGLDGKTPIAVSGAYFTPKGAPPAGGWPLVAWAHGTVGSADVCAPSWAGRKERDVKYLNAWLSQGFAVMASDYQGLGTPGLHPYMATRPEAYSMLDGIRAVLGSEPGLSGKVLIVGQSQGAGAAIATAGFAPVYAPDIDIRGTVATGTPYITLDNPSGSVRVEDPDRVDPTLANQYFITLTLQLLHPEVRDTDVFTALAAPLLDEAQRVCSKPLAELVVAAGLTRNNALQPGTAALFTPLVPALTYPTLKLETPLFMGIGAADVTADAARQLAFAKDACAAGTIVVAHLYDGLDHSGAVIPSLKDSLPFVRAALDRAPITPRCTPEPEPADPP